VSLKFYLIVRGVAGARCRVLSRGELSVNGSEKLP
jgi:hypothetical protein